MLGVFQLQIWRNIATGVASAARKGVISRRRKPMPVNPGIDKRLQAFQEAEKGLPAMTEEVVDDFELDMMNADEALDDHETEMAVRDHIRTVKIVERKYFKKAKEPSMLFWEEKEQIRYLHNSDPEEWNVTRLAESFPVSEAGAKKVLKANWSPQDTERILKYNDTVKKNWKLLEEGKLDVDEKLRTHLMKFVSRMQAKLSSTDSHLAITASKSMGKDSSNATSKVTESERHSVKKNEKTQQSVQKKGNKNKALHGTYRVGDCHYDVDDGEFLFRVPGMDR